MLALCRMLGTKHFHLYFPNLRVKVFFLRSLAASGRVKKELSAIYQFVHFFRNKEVKRFTLKYVFITSIKVFFIKSKKKG
jgi:hypothetical protein